MNQLEIIAPNDVALAEHAAVIRALGKRIASDFIEIGRRLVDCKKLAGHGHWLSWLDREFGWSEDTAENYILVHKVFRTNSEDFRNFKLPMYSLRLLAAPGTPEEVREAVREAAADGEHLTHAEVKEMVDKAIEAQRKENEAQLLRANAEAEQRLQQQLAATRVEAKEREAAVRAEYDGKLIVNPEELQTEIEKAIAPFKRQVEKSEAELAKIRKREQERIDRERAERDAQAGKGNNTAAPIDAEASLRESALRSRLGDFSQEAIKIAPDKSIRMACAGAEATGQTLAQWLSESPSQARASVAWLSKFLELCAEKGVK